MSIAFCLQALSFRLAVSGFRRAGSRDSQFQGFRASGSSSIWGFRALGSSSFGSLELQGLAVYVAGFQIFRAPANTWPASDALAGQNRWC